MQPVEVGDSTATRTVIAKGLKAGERVVLDGQYRLTPGALVTDVSAGKTVAREADAGTASGAKQ